MSDESILENMSKKRDNLKGNQRKHLKTFNFYSFCQQSFSFLLTCLRMFLFRRVKTSDVKNVVHFTVPRLFSFSLSIFLFPLLMMTVSNSQLVAPWFIFPLTICTLYFGFPSSFSSDYLLQLLRKPSHTHTHTHTKNVSVKKDTCNTTLRNVVFYRILLFLLIDTK